MRPQTAYRKVYSAIDKCLYKGVALKPELIPAIDKLIEKCIRRSHRISIDWGIEPTVYNKEELENSYTVTENNFGDLMYISDRFNAPHRLYWLRLMVERNMFAGGITAHVYWDRVYDKKLTDWIVVDGYCACRVPVGLDPEDPANRVAFIEKVPRVRINEFTDIDSEQTAWIFGPKGSGGCGNAREEGLYGFYQPSRDWCDRQLIEMGYILPSLGE